MNILKPVTGDKGLTCLGKPIPVTYFSMQNFDEMQQANHIAESIIKFAPSNSSSYMVIPYSMIFEEKPFATSSIVSILVQFFK